MSDVFKQTLYRPSPPRLVTVLRTLRVVPNLVSITFTGDGIESFPEHCPAAHIKIFFPRPGQRVPSLPQLGPDGPIWPEGDQRPLVRTFSVRGYRPKLQEIDIDFAIHAAGGPATRFALEAQPGQAVGLSHPGGPDPMIPNASHYALIGDMSAVPAIAAILAAMPTTSQGIVLLRADSAADIHELTAPKAMRVHWFVGAPPEVGPIVQAFKAADLPSDAHFWLGGEHKLVVALRRHLLVERSIPQTQVYAVPYWRHRFTEEGYHHTRHDVMNESVASMSQVSE